ncbi:hypothetical protein MVES1_001716 [Malassezia vespertilionis]|uniref:HTH TFE/IIEalpha-type domain-containing protein n=1 Tax=Malassezia vespertilionis TaxID=2020962 RepID=A0A2N1JCT4_9BASI|nr:uncharacterized protein MVES1_001716 [Malassezia vespertilionis]PKI84355.1 hypothetical protein MVES_001615 [Malassezia vespertilionis]WFD06371.1 hypothetical protein MVES1_001716 [Malassezia vespertilionis]
MAPVAGSVPSNAPAKDVQRSSAQPATPAQMDAIRRLVQVVVRLFYDDGHILLMDQLVSVAAIPTDVLARRVGLQPRDLGALAAKMVEDNLVSIHRSQENRDSLMARAFSRTYYYIDYKHFLDVIKWRMMAMRRHIDTKLRNGLDNKGYVCLRCRRSYSALEVGHLLNFSRNVFVCETPGCNTELVDNEDAEDVRRSKDTLTRFNEQLYVVQQALRSVEGVALPPMDIHAWLAKHAATQPWVHEMPRDDKQFVPGAAPRPTQKGPSVRVEMSGSDPTAELEKQQERVREEDKQRAQNMLPAWHLASTVSGERTGLGTAIAERRTDAAAAAPAAQQEEAHDEDIDYYARYTSQLETAPEEEGGWSDVDVDTLSGAKRKAEEDTELEAKRARTEPADDEDDDMEDVI